MSALKTQDEGDIYGEQIPPFNAAMVRTVIDEKLDLFFGPELSRVVRIPMV